MQYNMLFYKLQPYFEANTYNGGHMKYSTKLSDATHILAFIHLNQSKPLASADIAASIQTNPSYVRQLMAKLKIAGLIDSMRGQAKPTLSKKPDQISLLDIYRAIEGDKPLLHLDTNVNPQCNVGVYIQYALKDYYNDIQKVAENKMKEISLMDILITYTEKATLYKSQIFGTKE